MTAGRVAHRRPMPEIANSPRKVHEVRPRGRPTPARAHLDHTTRDRYGHVYDIERERLVQGLDVVAARGAGASLRPFSQQVTFWPHIFGQAAKPS